VHSTTPSGALVVADLNGDSLLDLAALQSLSFSLGVFFNQGNGTFAKTVYQPAGDQRAPAGGLASGDLNGDRIPDLVFSLFVDAGLDPLIYRFGVFLNTGDGTLGAVPNVDAAYFAIESFAIGDFNGDGAGDIVVAHGGSPAAIGVFLGNGDGTFSAPVTVNGRNCTTTVASNIAMSDLDGDGRPDLAFFCDDQLRVFLNRGGPGLLAGAVSYPGAAAVPMTGHSFPRAAVGDLNADGYVDLAILDGVSSTVSLFFNRGDGTFVGPTVVPAGTPFVSGSVAIADLDGNGVSDIVVVDTDSDSIRVLISSCSP
jgi:hypothetical protein